MPLDFFLGAVPVRRDTHSGAKRWWPHHSECRGRSLGMLQVAHRKPQGSLSTRLANWLERATLSKLRGEAFLQGRVGMPALVRMDTGECATPWSQHSSA
mmetsp:Transcript_27874/g.70026  ORF Transcript_27874/g.70026 Transcript_27874/m.70026 type:complete len:99 (+) Transcript_27874:243-539(+)